MEIMQRFFAHDDSHNYSDEELISCRKDYFQNYELKKEEHLTNSFELICDTCGCARYYQNNNFVIVCNCKCQEEAIVEEENKRKAEENLRKFQKLKSLSLLGKRYDNATFESIDINRPSDFVDAVKRCKKYCENWSEVKKRGLGIYLYGDVGTGKSHLTACIGNYLLQKFVPVLFTNFLEIVKQIRSTYRDKSTTTEASIIHDLVEVDLLIIDDIGTERFVKNGENTDMQEKIYDIVNARYVNQKPTIFSSNESLVQLVEDCGLMKKTVDRIAEMSTAKIELRGSSYRLTVQTKGGNSEIF